MTGTRQGDGGPPRQRELAEGLAGAQRPADPHRPSTELVPADADGTARVTRVVRDVADALTKLATHGTPSQVATYLHAAGFTGNRGEPFACPIRHYLCAAVPDVPDDLSLSVTRQRAQVHDVGWGGSCGAVDLPEAVGAFVRRFDSGVYPDLEDS